MPLSAAALPSSSYSYSQIVRFSGSSRTWTTQTPWRGGLAPQLGNGVVRAERKHGLVVEAARRNKRFPVEAMNLGHGGRNKKRAMVSGTEARMKTREGRKVIARRKAKGRKNVNPGDWPRAYSPTILHKFYPYGGYGGIVKPKDQFNPLTWGFDIISNLEHKLYNYEGRKVMVPQEGWEKYMGRMRYMMECKHGIAPYYDKETNCSYYLKDQEEGDDQRLETEWDEFVMSLEHHHLLPHNNYV